MFKKLISFLKGSSSATEITLLIIGPPSSGKTALIYFLYRFASNHLLGRRSNKDVDNNSENLSTSKIIYDENGFQIKEIDLLSFVNTVKKETSSLKDFRGTVAGGIDYINYDTGLIKLKIFNISGEIFSDITDDNSHKLKGMAKILNSSSPENVYVLLVDEYRTSVNPEIEIDFNHIILFFTQAGLVNASNIFHNIKEGNNTLRIVTKFDKFYSIPVPTTPIPDEKTKAYYIVEKALNILNDCDENKYLNFHRTFYNQPTPVSFDGSENKTLYRKFICTGLYDKNSLSSKLYENDDDSKKKVLKVDYRGNGLTRLEMYGVSEIFIFILKNRKSTKSINILKPFSGNRTNYSISPNGDYKKILNLDKK